MALGHPHHYHQLWHIAKWGEQLYSMIQSLKSYIEDKKQIDSISTGCGYKHLGRGHARCTIHWLWVSKHGQRHYPVMPLWFHVIFHSTVQSYSLLISSLVVGMKLMSRAAVDYQGTTDQRIWKTLTLAEWTEAIDKYKADAELRRYNEFSPTSTHYIASYHWLTTFRRLAKHLRISFGSSLRFWTDILPQVMLCWAKICIRNGGNLVQGALTQATSQWGLHDTLFICIGNSICYVSSCWSDCYT